MGREVGWMVSMDHLFDKNCGTGYKSTGEEIVLSHIQAFPRGDVSTASQASFDVGAAREESILNTLIMESLGSVATIARKGGVAHISRPLYRFMNLSSGLSLERFTSL